MSHIISYAPLWETLKRRNITQYQLIKTYGVSTGTLDALRKNQSITMNTLYDLCKVLGCQASDVVEFPDIEIISDRPKDLETQGPSL